MGKIVKKNNVNQYRCSLSIGNLPAPSSLLTSTLFQHSLQTYLKGGCISSTGLFPKHKLQVTIFDFLFLHYNSKKALLLINVDTLTPSLLQGKKFYEVTHYEN